MHYNTIIVRFGEMSTKGKNKKDFIYRLAASIRNSLREYEDFFELKIAHDHIYLFLKEENEDIVNILKDIPGMYSFSLALKVDQDLENIIDTSLNEIKNEVGKTFKVRTHRIDKSYPYISDEINRSVASNILKNTSLKVDVHNPDILLSIEIRIDGAYIFTTTIKGLGGYPKGSAGRLLMMLSGGLDSPVATYLMIKRGIEVSCIHFAAPPYTNIGVIEKLKDILTELKKYQPKFKLYVIPFTKIQEKIYEVSYEGYPITIMRRMMVRIATRMAKNMHMLAIATGDSIGQVASQTLESINVINEVTNFPIIRPLAVYDKIDIIKISEKINTYDISIRPYEDCCTIFAPVNPKTAPKLEDCKKIEEKFDFETLIEEAIKNVEVIKI